MLKIDLNRIWRRGMLSDSTPDFFGTQVAY